MPFLLLNSATWCSSPPFGREPPFTWGLLDTLRNARKPREMAPSAALPDRVLQNLHLRASSLHVPLDLPRFYLRDPLEERHRDAA